MSTFDSTKLPLPEILGDITKGKIQLPDFQRGWVWDDDHIRSLLVSIARSFPVGAVMILETGGDAKFQVRPVENVPFDGTPPAAELLILDGQQRLTTLAQVLSLKSAVKTQNDKGKAIERFYYFHIIPLKRYIIIFSTVLISESAFSVILPRRISPSLTLSKLSITILSA